MEIQVGNDTVPVSVWEDNDSNSYRGSIGIACFSLANMQTFRKIPDLVKSFRRQNPNVEIILVGTKCDLRRKNDKDSVPSPLGEEFYLKLRCAGYIECSSCTGINIAELWQYTAMVLKRRPLNRRVYLVGAPKDEASITTPIPQKHNVKMDFQRKDPIFLEFFRLFYPSLRNSLPYLTYNQLEKVLQSMFKKAPPRFKYALKHGLRPNSYFIQQPVLLEQMQFPNYQLPTTPYVIDTNLNKQYEIERPNPAPQEIQPSPQNIQQPYIQQYPMGYQQYQPYITPYPIQSPKRKKRSKKSKSKQADRLCYQTQWNTMDQKISKKRVDFVGFPYYSQNT